MNVKQHLDRLEQELKDERIAELEALLDRSIWATRVALDEWRQCRKVWPKRAALFGIACFLVGLAVAGRMLP